jgi:hypothetical protein
MEKIMSKLRDEVLNQIQPRSISKPPTYSLVVSGFFDDEIRRIKALARQKQLSSSCFIRAALRATILNDDGATSVAVGNKSYSA